MIKDNGKVARYTAVCKDGAVLDLQGRKYQNVDDLVDGVKRRNLVSQHGQGLLKMGYPIAFVLVSLCSQILCVRSDQDIHWWARRFTIVHFPVV